MEDENLNKAIEFVREEDVNLPDDDKVAEDFLYSGIKLEEVKQIVFNFEEKSETEAVVKELKEIQQLLKDSPNLTKVLDKLCDFRPCSLAGYLGLLQISTLLILVKEPPISVSLKISQLRGHLCSIPTSDWHDCPIKVHMTVETILSGLRSINNRDPLNLYHISRELWCVNDFLYFVSLTLAWVAFQDALRGMPIPTKEIHRPHNLNYMLQQLQTLDVSDYRNNLMKIYILLKIVALILHMTLTKVSSRAIPFAYRKEVGEASPEKLKELFDWFKCTQKSLRINDCENMAKMKIRELLEFEIFTILNHELIQSPLY
uniref:Uncharacterized protein n=1 Tax=Phlebotomus papatasi TaxID=29031 RepID=A0A1B0DQT6_PHLPP